MPKSSAISARIDPTLKQRAEEIFNELGLTASQAITLYYRQVTLHQGIPFAVSLPKQRAEAAVQADPLETSAAPNRAVDDTISTLYVSPERDQLLQEQQAYEAMHPTLWATYPNQFVAILGGKVVDRDQDELALLQRREENFPTQVVLIKQVTASPVTTLYVPDAIAVKIEQHALAVGLTPSRYLTRLVQQNLGEDWPEGYLEAVVGDWQGEPLVLPIQLDLEERDPLR